MAVVTVAIAGFTSPPRGAQRRSGGGDASAAHLTGVVVE
jgi:hypothetical protein